MLNECINTINNDEVWDLFFFGGIFAVLFVVNAVVNCHCSMPMPMPMPLLLVAVD